MFVLHDSARIDSPAAANSHGIEIPSNARWLYISRLVGPSQSSGRSGSAGDRLQAGHRPASTLLVVSALANPHWLAEVETVAAKS